MYSFCNWQLKIKEIEDGSLVLTEDEAYLRKFYLKITLASSDSFVSLVSSKDKNYDLGEEVGES